MLSATAMHRAVQTCNSLGLAMALLLTKVAPLARLPQVVLACCAGKDVYMDVQGWHLYLKDASAGKGLKIAEALAQQLGSEMSQGKFQSQDLEGILKKVRAPSCCLLRWGQPRGVQCYGRHQQHAHPLAWQQTSHTGATSCRCLSHLAVARRRCLFLTSSQLPGSVTCKTY